MAEPKAIPKGDPVIVDVQGIGPVEFPPGTSGAQIQSWVMNQLQQAGVPSQSWGDYLGNMAGRVGGGIAGGLIGSLAGPVGTFAGTATGAALGEEWAQHREVAQGVRDNVNPVSIAAAGATAPIPGATMGAGPLLRQVPRAFAAGLPASSAGSAATQWAETGTVDPWQVGKDAVKGATLGTLMGAGTQGMSRAAQSPAMGKLLRDETGAVGRKPKPAATLAQFRAALGDRADEVILAYEDDVAQVSDNYRSNSGRNKAEVNAGKFLQWLESPKADALAPDDADWRELLTQARQATRPAPAPSAAGTLGKVTQAWDAAGIDHAAYESNGLIRLSKIVVPKDQRNSGVGTQAMQALVEYADATGQRVALSPSSDFGGSKARLTAFYRRFGFQPNSGRSKDLAVSETMIREPKR
jgi:GNAT superfamily N-acetyltransferase